MTRTIFCIAALASLAACGDGNPFTATEDANADTTVNNFYGADLNDDLTMNNLTYDSDKDQLVINNLPFDGVDGRYSYNKSKSIGNKFKVYESARATGSRSGYYAVFRRSASGHAQAAAVVTNRYAGYGFGGATAQRLNDNITMPSEGEYVFTGEYAALRIRGDSAQEQYVSGNARIEIDVTDFDTKGAVEGLINNRKLYDRDGKFVRNMTGYISMATTSIDFATATTTDGTATLFDSTGDDEASGKWKGVFAGPNADEMAGIIVIETLGTATTVGAYRETGAFVTKD